MLSILAVFLASIIFIGAISYLLYTYLDTTSIDTIYSEDFAIPSRTTELVSENKQCNTPEIEDEAENEAEISMEDILKMRNSSGETLEQKVLQKTSGMGYREGPPGPTDASDDGRASKPEAQLSHDKNSKVVWSNDTAKPTPSHLMESPDNNTVGGILPGLDREGGNYSPL